MLLLVDIQLFTLLGLFRRNLFLNLIFLFGFTIVLHGYYIWLGGEEIETNWSFELLEKFFGFISANMYIKILASVILITLQAILVNDLVIKHKLSRALSTIPGAMFVILSATILISEIFHPILLANLFFILSIRSLYQIYKKHLPMVIIFNSGLFMALAALIYPPYIIFMLVLVLGLLSLRNMELRESLQMVAGILAPFYLFGVYLFFVGGLPIMWQHFSSNMGNPWTNWTWDIQSIAKPALFVILILTVIAFNDSLKKKKKFDAIKKIELCNWMLLLAVFTIFFMKDLGEYHLLIVSAPLAVLSGMIMEAKQNSIVKEFLFLILIAIHGAFILGVV